MTTNEPHTVETDTPANDSRVRDSAQTMVRGATGPRTPEGKQRSRYNATKHGIFREGIIEGRESRKQYDLLLSSLHNDFQPVGALEELLVEKLAMLFWRYRRLLRAEREETEDVEAPSLMSMSYPTADRLARYEAVLERAIDRTLMQLERWQRMRLGDAVPPRMVLEVNQS